MRDRVPKPKARQKHITSADVGRYLKHLALLNRDPLTGNPALSDALSEISAILIAGKTAPATRILEKHVGQNRLSFDEELDFTKLSLEKVRDILSRPDLTRSDLATIGTERFGIAKSRMDRISRDEIVQAISSAMQHEESLAIISEEAKRHIRTS